MAGFLSVLALVLIAGNSLAFPHDHREDTVLPFSLSPGNVNLETYYLDKYPQPGLPGGALTKKPTSQMTPSPLEAPEGNMFLVAKMQDPHAVFRTRRAALPMPQYNSPYGGHHHGGHYGGYQQPHGSHHSHQQYSNYQSHQKHHYNNNRNQYRIQPYPYQAY